MYVCLSVWSDLPEGRFTRKCLLTCDNAGAGDWQPVGLSVAMITTVGPR